MSNLWINIVKEKCPFCEKGKVFKKKKFLFQMPKINDNCTSCGKDFNGEPGYFFGAMYVSYGFAVALGILTFLVCRFILGIYSFNLVAGLIIGVITVFSYKNFKWSRIIWLKIFPPGLGTNFLGGGNKKIT
ncbi:MAG: hypothetical protein JWO32_161 [Bacteroidetes bacterium]|nr:hypothetical protein [Bacteroidota bacterium]